MTCLRQLFLTLIVIALAGCASPNPKTETTGKRLYSAADTSRTIDLTHPPHDLWDRIRRGFAIPNLNTDLTEHWTNYYASYPDSVSRMTQRASKYLYYIVEELENRGLPSELALLPFVESAYDPTALSRSKASGLWQFIPSTGRHYNLEQDWWMDERRDPIASTNAALDYLAYLYDFQGDWYLALASYNWGEGSVKRAIAKNVAAALATDYLSLKMPDETRNYVPKLQAIKNIIADPVKYGLTLPEVSNTPYFTAIRKQRNIDIAVAAQLAEMPIEDFKALNASHNQSVILVKRQPTLLLPTDRVNVFNQNLRDYRGKLSAWKVHEGKQGETFASIAKQYGVTLTELRQINGLSKNQTRAATRMLLVPDTTPDLDSVQLASLDSTDAIRVSVSATTAAANATATEQKNRITRRQPATAQTHTVKGGDTLFGLAKRYNTSVAELRKLNSLKGDHLAKGKRLRVPQSRVHS